MLKLGGFSYLKICWKFYGEATPPKTNMTSWNIHQVEDAFPIEDGDFPACHVSFRRWKLCMFFFLCASSPLMGIGGSIPLLKGNPSHIPLAAELQLLMGKCVLEE